MKWSDTAWAWFSIFLENPLVQVGRISCASPCVGVKRDTKADSGTSYSLTHQMKDRLLPLKQPVLHPLDPRIKPVSVPG